MGEKQKLFILLIQKYLSISVWLKRICTAQQITSLLVYQRGLRPTNETRAIILGRQANRYDPFIDHSDVLTCANVWAAGKSAREQKVFERSFSGLQPDGLTVSGRLGDLELDGPASLLLDHNGAVPDASTGSDVTDAIFHEITAAELRTDCQVEQGPVPDQAAVLKVELDFPDLLGLKRFFRSILETRAPSRWVEHLIFNGIGCLL